MQRQTNGLNRIAALFGFGLCIANSRKLAH